MRYSCLTKRALLGIVVFIPSISVALTTHITQNSSGNQANAFSEPVAITPDGRYVLFQSHADNLVANDFNGLQDVFVKDVMSDTITRVNISSAGDEANNNDSTAVAITPDGRYVLFYSAADNLVANDTNGRQDVFVRDLLLGNTTRVNTNSIGQEANAQGMPVAITPDGRYVLFWSAATNLVSNDTALKDAYVKDMYTGDIIRVANDSMGNESNGQTSPIAITPDGRYVLFQSDADNLVGDDTNGIRDIFVADINTNTIVRVSVGVMGNESNGQTSPIAITPDGRYVLFYSDADNLVANDTNGISDIFVRDMHLATTIRVTEDNQGIESNGYSLPIAITPDGQYVLFQSNASNLVTNDTNGYMDVFVKNIIDGTITIASIDTMGNAANSISYGVSISDDGRYVLFGSQADNLVPNDYTRGDDAFIRDILSGETVLVSVDSQGGQLSSSMIPTHLTPDGRFVLLRNNPNRFYNPSGLGQIYVNEWQVILGEAPVIYTPGDGEYRNYTGDIVVEGGGEVDADIRVQFLGNEFVAEVDENGGWSVVLPWQLDGTYTITAQQRRVGETEWSSTGQVTFTIDTERPGVPTIVTPIENALISGGVMYVVGVGEGGADVTVKVGKQIRVGSADGLGNWSIGPFSIVPGYKYSVQAKQRDMGGNEGEWSGVRTIYGVMQGTTSINEGDYKPDLVLYKRGVSGSGSMSTTNVNENIRYTLDYANIGRGYATGVMIMEEIPVNTCFVIGSIDGLGEEYMVEYSTDRGVSYGHEPLGGYGEQDCSITHFRVRMKTAYDAKPNVVVDYLGGTSTGLDIIQGVARIKPLVASMLYKPGQANTTYYRSLTGDFNGDGIIDIYSTQSWNTNRTFDISYGTADLSVMRVDTMTIPYPVGANGGVFGMRAAGVVDINNDGYDDIVATTCCNRTVTGDVYILYGSSLGVSFDNYYNVDVGNVIDVQIDDINNDGYQDILVLGGGPKLIPYNQALGKMVIIYGGQTQIIPSNILELSPNAIGFWEGGVNIRIGDFNADGNKDIAVDRRSGIPLQISIFTGSSTGYYTNNNQLLISIPGKQNRFDSDMATLDINNDGFDDLLFGGADGVYLYTGATQMSTGSYMKLSGFTTEPKDLLVIDINKDGYDDVVGIARFGPATLVLGGPNIYQYLTLPSTAVSPNFEVGTFYKYVIQYGDVNNDSFVDVIVPNTTTNGYMIFGGTEIHSGNIVNIPDSHQHHIAVYDVNSDGFDDIITRGPNSGFVRVILGNESGNLQNSMFLPINLGFNMLSQPSGIPLFDDFDNDGKSEGLFLGLNSKLIVDITVPTTGTYEVILASTGNITRWNKIVVDEEIRDGENEIGYNVYGVTGGVCDRGNMIIGPIQSENGEIDVSMIGGEYREICIEGEFRIMTGNIGPVLRSIVGMWDNEDVDSFTFDVKVKGSNLVGRTVRNTAYIVTSSEELGTGNNMDTHEFEGLPENVNINGFGGDQGRGGVVGGREIVNVGGGGGRGGIIVVTTPQAKAEEIRVIEMDKPTEPVVVTPPIDEMGKREVEIRPSSPESAISDAMIQTRNVEVGSSVGVKTVENPVLKGEKRCYSPKEVVEIRLGENTRSRDLLVYQALLHSYDLTIFTDTDSYRPDSGLKRHEAAKMFTNFAKHVLCREKMREYRDNYSDIAETDPTLKPYIIEAYEYGILQGSQGKFRPSDRISRKEFVAALMRMFLNENLDVIGVGNEWDREYVRAFEYYGLGEIVGDEGEIDRYEMSKIVYKLYYNTTYEWSEKGYVLPYKHNE